MIRFVINRFVYMILTLAAVSMVAFVLIQLPPGDFADSYANKRQQAGAPIKVEELDEIRRRLGIDKPWYIQYGKWISNMVLEGDMGYSWEWRRPVSDLIAERLPLTLLLAFSTLILMYGLAIPIGIYSAVRQYSATDHIFSTVGYVGLAIPNFLLALILMYLGQQWFGQSVGGLFSPEYQDAPWSWPRVVNLAEHLWVPVVVLGTAGTAYLIRTIRASTLDELDKMYVMAARAGGLSPMRLLLKYPVRMALNPIVATLGWRLTYVISGAPIVGVVMSLPDTGPLFLHALLNQDMYLAGGMVLIYCAFTIIGTFISDLLLVLLDPRIRMEGQA
ncbi:MAG: ABC transporter permease [Akkermansiaceae bacterium]|jgi:peptide/nickel transport system permease protein|nr:ABC transporter permease [Akkermansiaceae bacterium]MDE0976349.1 ABC transporter permease [Arenicellales bacterium]